MSLPKEFRDLPQIEGGGWFERRRCAKARASFIEQQLDAHRTDVGGSQFWPALRNALSRPAARTVDFWKYDQSKDFSKLFRLEFFLLLPELWWSELKEYLYPPCSIGPWFLPAETRPELLHQELLEKNVTTPEDCIKLVRHSHSDVRMAGLKRMAELKGGK